MKQIRKFNRVDLVKIALACLKRWKQVVLVTALCGGAALLFTVLCIPPTYTSTVQIYVNNSDITESSSSVSTSDLNASAQLVDLYEVILNTDDTLDLIREDTGLDYSYAQLKSMISTSSVNGTQVFRVTVASSSPEEAQLIASTIGDILPEVITEIVQGADARVVSHAKVPSSRSAPNYFHNAALGALAGFVLVFLIIAAMELTDTVVHSEQDVAELVQAPILAYIPYFPNADKEQPYAYGQKQ